MNVAYAESENKTNHSTLFELQQRMSGIISEIEQSNTELSRIQRYNLLSMQMLKQKTSPPWWWFSMLHWVPTLSTAALLGYNGTSPVLMTFFILLLYWKLRYGVYRLFIRRWVYIIKIRILMLIRYCIVVAGGRGAGWNPYPKTIFRDW